MTFQSGDRVHVVTAISSVMVLEQDGDFVYVELPNGVEMEYDASVIILESDYVLPEEKKWNEQVAVDDDAEGIAGFINYCVDYCR